MKLLSLSLVLLMAAVAQGQQDTHTPPPVPDLLTCTSADQSACLGILPSTPMTFIIGGIDAIPIIQCGGSADGKAKNCVISPGHTLDDAINAVFDATRTQGDQCQQFIDEETRRADALYKIARRENKALFTYSDGLRKVAKSLEKIGAKP